MKIPLVLLGLAGAACAPLESTPPPPEAPAGACNAQPAQGLVGRRGRPALARQAQRLSGARTVRWLRPGQVVTMEFRADRLNLHLDAGNRVERIVCG